MSYRTIARSSSLLAGLALAVLSPPAWAKKPADEDKAKASAKAHFDRGTAFSEAGAYDRAAREFKAAYADVPLPDFLFNVGQACRLERDEPCAVEYYRRYVDKAPDGRGADEARRWVATLQSQRVAPAAPPEVETAPPAAPAPVTSTSPAPPPAAALSPAHAGEPTQPEAAPSPRLSGTPPDSTQAMTNGHPTTLRLSSDDSAQAESGTPTPPPAAPKSKRGAVIGGVVGGLVAVGGALGIGLGVGLDTGPSGPPSSASWGTVSPFH